MRTVISFTVPRNLNMNMHRPRCELSHSTGLDPGSHSGHANRLMGWEGRLQQLLREWESRSQAKPTSTAEYRSARARSKPEAAEPPVEQPLEVLFVPCPCDRCEFRRRCAAGMACERFALFLDGS